MKFKKIAIQFDADDLVSAEEMICDIFFSFNLKGVVCDIPLEEPDDGFGTHTLMQPSIYSITGYLPLLDSSDVIIRQIKEKAQALSLLKITTAVTIEVVDEKDWADAWKDYFEVTPVTGRITIKPQWKDHVERKDEIVIHLDPGMAFGTGTHPSTAMCIKLIEHYLVPGSTFLDVGTGSGILMIAAAKLGAQKLLGIDTDEVAITVARQNIERNDISPDSFDLICTTLENTDPIPYDCIAVNIIAQFIVTLLPRISVRMSASTVTILSGIIKDRLKDVTTALDKHNLCVIREQEMEEWVTLAVKKNFNKETA